MSNCVEKRKMDGLIDQWVECYTPSIRVVDPIPTRDSGLLYYTPSISVVDPIPTRDSGLLHYTDHKV